MQTAPTLIKPPEGDGTPEKPYLIANAGNLYWFAEKVNSGSKSINGKLTKNITVNSGVLKSDGTLNTGDFRAWTPIGNYFNAYDGTFNGNGNCISNLCFNDTDKEYVGLFGYVGNNGRVMNVAVKDFYLKAKSCVGGVVGYNYFGTVTNCSVSSGTVTGASVVGGVVGDNVFGTITNCYYLSGCAKDGNGTLQNGVGYGLIGSTKADADAQTEAKTAADFASGEVSYLLNSGETDGTQVWYQTCGEGYPAFSGKTVYYDSSKNPQYYNNTTSDKVASVSVTWTDMSFSYNKGTWDTDTMTWEGGGWEADAGCGTVTVTNTGDLDVTAQFGVNFPDDFFGISVSFVESDVALTDNKLKLDKSEVKTVTVKLTGNEPSEYIETAKTIGQIIITLSTE